MNRSQVKRQMKRGGNAQQQGGRKKADAAAEERKVVIVDELAEFLAEDPTFGGLREDAPTEIAHAKAVAALRELHQQRFRHAFPTDDALLFDELANEVDLPHEALIRRLLTCKKEHTPLTDEEEEKILKIIEEFVEKTKHLGS